MSLLHLILWTMRYLLLERLNITFNLSGNLLLWLRSLLSERPFCVVRGSSRSFWPLPLMQWRRPGAEFGGDGTFFADQDFLKEVFLEKISIFPATISDDLF